MDNLPELQFSSSSLPDLNFENPSTLDFKSNKKVKGNSLFDGIGLYFKEAQPAFKLAVSHPETLFGKPAIAPGANQPMNLEELNQTTNQPWSDIYRGASAQLPGAKSQTIAGQLIPEVAGTMLEFGTKPSTYFIPQVFKKATVGATQVPFLRRFLARQTPTLSKSLLAKNPIEPVFKDTDFGKVDITQPYKPAPEISLRKIKEIFSMNKNYTLDRTKQAIDLIDQTRSSFGVKVSGAIKKFEDVKVDAKKLTEDLPPLSKSVATALDDPIYNIEKLPDGSLKSTIGNMHKVQEAFGDFMTSKDWMEATTKNKQNISKAYGAVAEAIKTAEPSLREPISHYARFMNLYREVNPTLRNTQGIPLEKKLRTAFKPGAEREYQIAWAKLSKVIPELENISKDVVRFNNRQIAKTAAKRVAPWIILGGVGGVTASRFVRNESPRY